MMRPGNASRAGPAGALFLAVALGGPPLLLAQAQTGSGAPAPAGGPASSAVRTAGRTGREQWNGMTPEDKKSMREIFELLKDLSPQRREQLLTRLRGMSPEERRELIEVARARVRDREEDKRRETERPPAGEREREIRQRRIERNLRLWEERLPSPVRETVRHFSQE